MTILTITGVADFVTARGDNISEASSSRTKQLLQHNSCYIPTSPNSLKLLRHTQDINNCLIRQQLSSGHLREALSTLDVLSKHGTHPDLITYSLLLKSCIRSRAFRLGHLVHAHLIQSRLVPDQVLFNSLITLYSKSGDVANAREIFLNMGDQRDLVSYSAIISCFANNGLELEAIGIFIDMIKLGFEPNEYCYTAVIRACSKRETFSLGEMVLGSVLKCGYLEKDVNVGCALIDMFVKGMGDLGNAYKVFDRMPERNVVTWTLMITRFVQLGFAVDSIHLFLDMILDGNVPDSFTLTGVISACSESGILRLGQQVHCWAIKSGVDKDVCVGCSLVDMYAKCAADGSVGDSRKVFDRMPDHNVMSWTSIITGYVQRGGCDVDAVKLFCEMIHDHQVVPNHFTFSSVLKACGNLSQPHLGEQVHAHAVKRSLVSVNCVGNSIISMYAKCGSMENSQKAFDCLFEKNLVSYNTIVDAYAKCSNSEKSFGLFNEIEEIGIGVSAFTFASLLSGASNVGAIGKGEQIHARLLKSNFQSNIQVSNALISMYSRCGNIEAAFLVYNNMEEKNVISWTSIITGYAKHGFATRALQLFNKMIEASVKPNDVTYIAVLSACSHVGLVSEGWEHFKSMHKEHGISQRMEHYACMVDLLGRSGSLIEALEFITSMPFTANALVWRTFLGACQIHSNIELGEHAASMILDQDPNDPSAYVMLSNLYASVGKWEYVADIRKKMKVRKLTKEAGCSWIEVENKVHKFYVGDTLHLQAGEIYNELDRLGLKIRELGYVPDTNFVLHQVDDEEEKEQYLFQHSEKLAVAFGLICTSSSKPIRVFKNLRVCGDCHTAIKYFSLATGRVIVVRDSNRFHHMKDGKCSCNDYW